LVIRVGTEHGAIVTSTSERVGTLRLLLEGTTLVEDGDVDKLTGASGQDWFFTAAGDVITDLKSYEIKG
jgi:hypothetical protein